MMPGGTDWKENVKQAGKAREALREHCRAWLHGHDETQLDFILAVAITAGGAEEGEKLWGIVVGVSSSGKSEDEKMVFGVADARLSDLTAAGLLSWIGADKKNAKVTGLLTRLPSPAFVVIEDLAPLMSDTADKRNRSKLVAMLRKVYDGEVQRDLGGTPGQASWQGHVTMLAASTKVIDQQSALLDEAGPRWLIYRSKEADSATRVHGARGALSAAEKKAKRARAAGLATEAVRHGRIAFGHMELSDTATGTLGDIAVAVGIMRGNVPRDGYGRREIIGLASTEEPYRLAAQLQLLARAAMAYGYSEERAVGLARTVALGTVPPDRMKALEVLCDGETHNASEIGREKKMHRHVAGRALEDLAQLRITVCTNEDAVIPGISKTWRLARTDEGRISAHVIGGMGVGTKNGKHPPVPPEGEDLEEDPGRERSTADTLFVPGLDGYENPDGTYNWDAIYAMADHTPHAPEGLGGRRTGQALVVADRSAKSLWQHLGGRRAPSPAFPSPGSRATLATWTRWWSSWCAARTASFIRPVSRARLPSASASAR